MRVRATVVVIATTLALITALTGCGSGEPATSPAVATTKPKPASEGPDLAKETFVDLTAEAEVLVDVRDNAFDEKYIEVKAGTPITFDNRGRTEHNVLPVTPGAFAQIDADDLEPGVEQTLTFEVPGDYAYYCSLHGTKTKGMVGAVRVLE